ncbi:SH3 domain-binding protein 5-like [Leptonychotes weddellii]|uniref:SH3 domain-binding protein 5 n=1 Tax=Leptonychotes weddellii TaxID=9713 RepID=A0A7F8RNH2_LEPWE|nr:SH3 domain-binding protein 5-like [Leptonychotes weddellii]
MLDQDGAQLEAQKATQDFQRATEVLRAAKETISLAEQRLLEDDKRQFDSAWQEMLNHATQRIIPEGLDCGLGFTEGPGYFPGPVPTEFQAEWLSIESQMEDLD